jgi:hypothetical protein
LDGKKSLPGTEIELKMDEVGKGKIGNIFSQIMISSCSSWGALRSSSSENPKKYK